eukprot:63036-Pleurochrysis_carterae.AAC.2
MSGRGKPVHPPVANASLDLNGAQFSVLNSMRTGNMIIDMIIALLVPFFFKLIFSDSKQLLLRIYDFLFDRKPSEDECIREISFLSVGSSLTGRDHKNQLLQKAITLYLTEEMRLPFESRAQVSLTAFHDTSVGMGPIDKYNPLARYRLMWQPPENSWIQIEPGLEFQQRTKREGADEDEDDRGNLRPIQREMIIFELKTSKKDGPQQIDRFIERALSWYKQELLKMRDDARCVAAQWTVFFSLDAVHVHNDFKVAVCEHRERNDLYEARGDWRRQQGRHAIQTVKAQKRAFALM